MRDELYPEIWREADDLKSECRTPKEPALALRDKILEQVPPMGTELKTVKHKLSDPNVNNAVVLMDIEVIRNMTMFPIC